MTGILGPGLGMAAFGVHLHRGNHAVIRRLTHWRRGGVLRNGRPAR